MGFGPLFMGGASNARARPTGRDVTKELNRGLIHFWTMATIQAGEADRNRLYVTSLVSFQVSLTSIFCNSTINFWTGYNFGTTIVLIGATPMAEPILPTALLQFQKLDKKKFLEFKMISSDLLEYLNSV